MLLAPHSNEEPASPELHGVSEIWKIFPRLKASKETLGELKLCGLLVTGDDPEARWRNEEKTSKLACPVDAMLLDMLLDRRVDREQVGLRLRFDEREQPIEAAANHGRGNRERRRVNDLGEHLETWAVSLAFLHHLSNFPSMLGFARGINAERPHHRPRILGFLRHPLYRRASPLLFIRLM
jgi:hypothetical protein